ncbi:BN159_2729 family protein [Streptomyces cadmiisoli]|uniref:BN159_2729 family protein n=1 Tax=Streptomyces cadmiisoli TaxID=2184053 RepID=UPI003D75FBAE
MNKNIPHAIRIVRKALESGSSDPAAAVVRELDAAHLLTDIERGRVLYRTPAGGWSEQPQPHPQPEPEMTELEQQALAWDQSCQRAHVVAAAIEKAIGDHPSYQRVQVERDGVLVALHVTDQAQWAEWRRYFGITHDQEQPLPYVVGGQGYRDGVRVSVLAYDLPQVQARTEQSAGRPFRLGGMVYDLALPQRDASGAVWYHQGERESDGMPLMSLDGRTERCSLATILGHSGPLTAVTTGVTGGETA